MRITKVYTQYGRLLTTYPDAVCTSDDEEQWIYVFESGIHSDDWDFAADGNWIACLHGPVITIEERQSDADNSSVPR